MTMLHVPNLILNGRIRFLVNRNTPCTFFKLKSLTVSNTAFFLQQKILHSEISPPIKQRNIMNILEKKSPDVQFKRKWWDFHFWGSKIYSATHIEKKYSSQSALEQEELAFENINLVSYQELLEIFGWHFIFSHRVNRKLLEFILKNVAKDFKRHPQWNPESVSQLMFCVYVNHSADKSVFRNVEYILEKDLQNYNPSQCLIVLKAWRKCMMTFENEVVVNDFWKYFNTYTVEGGLFQLSDSEKAEFLKNSTNVLTNGLTLTLLGDMVNKGVFFPHSFSNAENVSPYLRFMLTHRYYHAKFIQEVTDGILLLDPLYKMRRKTVADFCRFLCSFGVKGDENLVYKKLVLLYSSTVSPGAETFKDELEMNKRSPLVLTLYSAMSGVFVWKLILQYLNDGFARYHIRKLVEGSPDELVYQLLLLQACVDIEGRSTDGYKDFKGLSKHMVWRLRDTAPSFTLYGTQKKYLEKYVLAAMNTVLHDRYCFHSIIPPLNAVVEIRLDSENRPMSFVPVPYDKFSTATPDLDNTARRIAFVLCNRRQVTRNIENCIMGNLLCHVNLLTCLGYEVIKIFPIDKSLINEASSFHDMRNFIEKKLIEHSVKYDGQKEVERKYSEEISRNRKAHQEHNKATNQNLKNGWVNTEKIGIDNKTSMEHNKTTDQNKNKGWVNTEKIGTDEKTRMEHNKTTDQNKNKRSVNIEKIGSDDKARMEHNKTTDQTKNKGWVNTEKIGTDIKARMEHNKTTDQNKNKRSVNMEKIGTDNKTRMEHNKTTDQNKNKGWVNIEKIGTDNKARMEHNKTTDQNKNKRSVNMEKIGTDDKARMEHNKTTDQNKNKRSVNIEKIGTDDKARMEHNKTTDQTKNKGWVNTEKIRTDNKTRMEHNKTTDRNKNKRLVNIEKIGTDDKARMEHNKPTDQNKNRGWVNTEKIGTNNKARMEHNKTTDQNKNKRSVNIEKIGTDDKGRMEHNKTTDQNKNRGWVNTEKIGTDNKTRMEHNKTTDQNKNKGWVNTEKIGTDNKTRMEHNKTTDQNKNRGWVNTEKIGTDNKTRMEHNKTTDQNKNKGWVKIGADNKAKMEHNKTTDQNKNRGWVNTLKIGTDDKARMEQNKTTDQTKDKGWVNTEKIGTDDKARMEHNKTTDQTKNREWVNTEKIGTDNRTRMEHNKTTGQNKNKRSVNIEMIGADNKARVEHNKTTDLSKNKR